MNTFTFTYPTKVYFGEKVAAEALKGELSKVGKTVMLAYGGGSIKKNVIYDEIKVKSDKYIRLDFKNVESFDLVKTIEIPNREDALNLLKMTPHYYHIKKERRSVLDTLDKLNVTIDVKVTVYQV